MADWWASDPVAPGYQEPPIALQPNETVMSVGQPKGSPAQQAPSGNFWESDQIVTPAPSPELSTAGKAWDIAKGVGTGLVKGVEAIPGMIGDVSKMADALPAYAGAFAAEKLGLLPEGKTGAEMIRAANALGNQMPRDPFTAPTSSDIQQAAEDVAGPLPRPQTTAGQVAQNVTSFLPPAIASGGASLPVAARAVGAGLGSEAAGRLATGSAYQPVAQALGAFGGGAAPGVASRAITPLPSAPGRQAAVSTFAQEGIPMTAGQRTGSRPLRYMETALGDMPMAGGKAALIAENQQRAYNAAVLRRMGVSDSTEATPEVLQGGYDAMGARFKQLASRNTLKMDPKLGDDLMQVARDYGDTTLPSAAKPIVRKTLTDLVTMDRDGMPGHRYQAVRSMLGKQAQAFRISDPSTSQALKGIQRAMDSAMERSISPADAQAWKEVRGHYRNWKVIEKAASGAGENAAEGNISAPRLASALVQQDRGGYVRGQGDLAPLARAGRVMMTSPPNSGTAPRMHAQELMKVGGGLLGAGVGAVAGHPIEGGAAGYGLGAAGSIAGPALMGRAVMSRPAQAWFGNQALPAFASAPLSRLGSIDQATVDAIKHRQRLRGSAR
jgi:hypothetical protein